MTTERNRRAWAAHAWLLLVPAYLVAVCFFLREHAGPFWQWNLLDPAYFYLFDSLNLISGNAPGHVGHPGVPVYTMGAALLKVMYFGAPADAIIDAAIGDPETPLRWMSTLFIVLAGAATWGLGLVARRGFGALLPALACQAAPLMSTIVLKHLFLPKPEAVITLATVLLIAVIAAGMRPGALAARPAAFGAAFGLIAGLGVATKLTFAPICLLPLLLPGARRMALAYLAAAALAFLIFMLPAAGAWAEFIDWMTRVAVGAGDYDSGPKTVIDPEAYPQSFLKILKRPSLKVPMALALVTLGVGFWRRRDASEADVRETRVLFAVTAAQLAQVVLVAKQPVAFYMIPAYMLSALSVLLSVRLLWRLATRRWSPPFGAAGAAAVALAAVAAVQAAGVLRLDDHLTTRQALAASVDARPFGRCAQIYIYSASHPVYALSLGDRVTGFRFTGRLKAVTPPNVYWIDDWNQRRPPVLRNHDGPVALSALRDAYPCLYFRGNRPNAIAKFLAAEAPGLTTTAACSTADEPIVAAGVDCRGRPTK